MDTNVIISAALSPEGNASRVLRWIKDDESITFFHNSAILAEYTDVLSREKLKIPKRTQNKILEMMIETGVNFEPPVSIMPMPDESDRIFYDTAKAMGAILITGNTKHYPDEAFIVTPAEFLNQ